MESETLDRAERFLSLHTQNYHRISAFVHTLVADWQDAEEIVQDTLLILWRKFDEFDLETEFFPWAARVAQYEVLNYRRRRQRQAVMLDVETINALAATSLEVMTDVSQQRELLAQCLKLLSERERIIVGLRYRDRGSVNSIADTIGRSTSHVHRLLRRIRERLMRCVRTKLTQPSI